MILREPLAVLTAAPKTLAGALTAVSLLLALASPALAVERIIKKDGSSLTGEVIGFRDGRYTIQVGETTVDVPAADVKTILEEAAAPPRPAVAPEHLDLQGVLEALSARRRVGIAGSPPGLFEDAVAAVIRGEWDVTLKILDRLRDGDPGGTDPLILAAMVYAERGEMRMALAIARQLEVLHDADALALQVSAEVYRRAGFPRAHARLQERGLEQAAAAGADGDGGPVRLEYRLTRLWWPVDAVRGAAHWQRYRELDSELRQPWCREGDALRQVEFSLASNDWASAQATLEEARQRFPWLADEVATRRVAVLEARLRAAELGGRLEEAMLAGAALAELAPDQTEEWSARIDGLRAFVLRRGLQATDFASLRRFCRDHAHVVDGAWHGRLSIRYQELALEALGAGDPATCRLAFAEARSWDAAARPDGLSESLAEAASRVRDDLRVERRDRVRATVVLLRDAYPERRQELEELLSTAYRSALQARTSPGELGAELIALGRLLDPPTAGGEPTIAVTPPAPTEIPEPQVALRVIDPIAAAAAVARYFPHRVGTRWVYRRGDGNEEVRRVVSLTPLEDGGWKVGIEVHTATDAEGVLTDVFIEGGNVFLNRPTAPPGELALRYPYIDGATWSWSKGSFEYQRTLRRPEASLVLPVGSFRDYLVVEMENRVTARAGTKSYSATARVFYVDGVGVARVESDDPTIARVLMEYVPGRDLSLRD